MNRFFLYFLLLPILVFAQSELPSAPANKKIKSLRDCGPGDPPMRFGLRHIEANGIGYTEGYSTAELFLSSPYSEDYRPFIDVRGHVFNNGKCAFNIGGGYRTRWDKRIYGWNIYYDWRNTSRVRYNQVGMGLEALGITWDFRVNGYVPVGATKSSWYHPIFDKFQGNQLYVNRKREFAMYGCNAEVAGRFPVGLGFEVVPAIGPYYFTNQGKNAVGGQFRFMAKYKDYVSLEGTVSYDTVFRDIYQGQIAIHFPFGKKREIRRDKSARLTCPGSLDAL